MIRNKHPELANVALVNVSTPDFKDAFEDGWSKATTKLVETLVIKPASGSARRPARINVLPGSHLTPGDLDELRDIIEAFGLQPTFLPDISGSLDGHVPEEFTPTTHGGVSVQQIALDGAGDPHHRDRRADASRRRGDAAEDRDRLHAVPPPHRARAQ